MSYADKLLVDGERIARPTQQHWFVFVGDARYAILAVVDRAPADPGSASASRTGGGDLRQLLGLVILVLVRRRPGRPRLDSAPLA